MSRRAVLAGGAGLLAASAAGTAAFAQSTPAPRLQGLFRIATGTTGGTYYPVGTIIANAISNPPGGRPCDKGGSCGVPGLIAVAQASNGSVDNISLLQSGGVEAGMVQADVGWWAYTGQGAYAGKAPFDRLRTMGTLYVEALHIVVAGFSGINRLADLKGRRISLSEAGSGTLVDARVVLEANGLNERELQASYVKPSVSADQLADGKLDGFFMVGGPPVLAIKELSSRVSIGLVALDPAERQRLRQAQRFFVDTMIPEGTYAFVPPTSTIGVGAELMVRADRDPELIYQITKAIWHERTRALLAEGGPGGFTIDVKNAVAGVAVPLHPGAERFYREIGLLGNAAGEAENPTSPPLTVPAAPR